MSSLRARKGETKIVKNDNSVAGTREEIREEFAGGIWGGTKTGRRVR